MEKRESKIKEGRRERGRERGRKGGREGGRKEGRKDKMVKLAKRDEK